ncbi:unnamed protein product [Gadus morhua 'NCC']
MTQDDDADAGRECVLKWLCVYLNEDPANLVREFVAEDEAAIKESIEDTTIAPFRAQPFKAPAATQSFKALTSTQHFQAS